MRCIYLLFIILFPPVHAAPNIDEKCDAQIAVHAQNAFNLLRSGIDFHILSVEDISNFGSSPEWSNPFFKSRGLPEGFDLHKGFEKLARALSPQDKAAAQQLAVNFSRDLIANAHRVTDAKNETAQIIAPKVSLKLSMDPSQMHFQRLLPAGHFQGRPVFSATFQDGPPFERSREYLVDAMNPDPTQRMVLIDPESWIDAATVTYVHQSGFISGDRSVRHTGAIYDLGQRKVVDSLPFEHLGIERLHEYFVENLDGKEKLVGTVHNSHSSPLRGLLLFDLSDFKTSPQVLLKGSFKFLRRDWVGGHLYISAYDFMEHKFVVINVTTGKKYEVSEPNSPIENTEAFVYENGGKPFLLYPRIERSGGGVGTTRIHVADLEGNQNEEFYTPLTLVTQIYFIRINDIPFVYYFTNNKLVFKDLQSKDERAFLGVENPNRSIDPFYYKGELYFIWSVFRSNLRVLNFQTGEIISVGPDGADFSEIRTFEFNGELYAIATRSFGEPALVKITHTSRE